MRFTLIAYGGTSTTRSPDRRAAHYRAREMSASPEIEVLRRRAEQSPIEELPRLLGDLEEVRCTAMVRLTLSVQAPAGPDELLDVKEAARRLGVSPDYLYRRHATYPFTRRNGRKLCFSAREMGEFIKTHKQLDSKAAQEYPRLVGTADGRKA